MLSLQANQIQQFKIDGYLVLPQLLLKNEHEELVDLTLKQLKSSKKPYELEADVHYPGAPTSHNAPGGDTIRRLLSAYQRHTQYQQLAQHPNVVSGISDILQSTQLCLNLNHHNCVMTKQPKFSSETWWHRDTRYWNFNNKYLINAWFALRDELSANGAMKILPGSHRWEVPDAALDEHQFLKKDHRYNLERLSTERTIELQAGDVVLFSAHAFHAAGKNTTNKTKLSAVFTYHDKTTEAIAGSKSAALAPIFL